MTDEIRILEDIKFWGSLFLTLFLSWYGLKKNPIDGFLFLIPICFSFFVMATSRPTGDRREGGWFFNRECKIGRNQTKKIITKDYARRREDNNGST